MRPELLALLLAPLSGAIRLPPFPAAAARPPRPKAAARSTVTLKPSETGMTAAVDIVVTVPGAMSTMEFKGTVPLVVAPTPPPPPPPPPPVTGTIVDLVLNGREVDQLPSGSAFVLNGTGFGTAGTVTVAGVAAAIQTWTPTRIGATIGSVTALALGPVIVTPSGVPPIVSAFGASVAPAVTPPPPPPPPPPAGARIENSLGQPIGAAAVGDSVKIVGRGFGLQPGTVWFDPIQPVAVVTKWSDGEVDCTVPNPGSGPRINLSVKLFLAGVPAPILVTETFTVNAATMPRIGMVAGTNGLPLTGLPADRTVVVTGQHFGPAPGRVTSGGLPMSVSSWTDTQITAVLPVGTSGTSPTGPDLSVIRVDGYWHTVGPLWPWVRPALTVLPEDPTDDAPPFRWTGEPPVFLDSDAFSAGGQWQALQAQVLPGSPPAWTPNGYLGDLPLVLFGTAYTVRLAVVPISGTPPPDPTP